MMCLPGPFLTIWGFLQVRVNLFRVSTEAGPEAQEAPLLHPLLLVGDRSHWKQHPVILLIGNSPLLTLVRPQQFLLSWKDFSWERREGASVSQCNLVWEVLPGAWGPHLNGDSDSVHSGVEPESLHF